MKRDLIELRHKLHQHAELSGVERETARIIHEFLRGGAPSRIITGMGGYGLAAVYRGESPGPRALLRSELDALPIEETPELPYRSLTPGVSHKCGHDGHMAMAAGLGELLSRRPPEKGEAALLFQPTEETGQGASGIIEDGKFLSVKPDYALSLHNLPGFPLGQVILRKGTFAAGSKGLIVSLQGVSVHAGEPEKGINPAGAVADLITGFNRLNYAMKDSCGRASLTVIGADLGEPCFGTSPGAGQVMATLRSSSQSALDNLSLECDALALKAGEKWGLRVETHWVEEFPLTVNDEGLVDLVSEAAGRAGLAVHYPAEPFRWSEDFGHFSTICRSALIGLGAGENHPPLHHPAYDFPDELIEAGVRLWSEIVGLLIGWE